MANRNKAKGTAWETAIVNFLREAGIVASRVVQHGRFDEGDIHVEGDYVIEAKNVQKIDLASFVEQAQSEALNAKRPFFAAVIKRRGKNASQGYVVTTLENWVALVRARKESDNEVHRDRL